MFSLLLLNWQSYPVFERERANHKKIIRAKCYDNVCLQCCLGNNKHLCTKNQQTQMNGVHRVCLPVKLLNQ